MLSPWALPLQAQIGRKTYDLNADFRDVLEVMSYLQDPVLPEFIRWQVALGLFFKQEVAPEHSQEAMTYLAWFLTGGNPEGDQPGPKLLDWEQDAAAIVSDINRVAGCEIRALEQLHWWTFLSWFHGIGEGQLSFLVTIRQKRRRGEKLTQAEQEFYRQNKEKVELKKIYSAEDRAEQERLKRLLGE